MPDTSLAGQANSYQPDPATTYPAGTKTIAEALDYAGQHLGGGGGVTAVTASAPLASSGGATPDISIASPIPIADGGTNAATANAGLNNLLPSQGGHAGDVLTSDGTNTSWQTPSVVLAPAVVFDPSPPGTPTTNIRSDRSANQGTTSAGLQGTTNLASRTIPGDSVTADYATALGINTSAGGRASTAEGDSTSTTGDGSHAEGANTLATSTGSHAEGQNSQATADMAHAEGDTGHATAHASHAEGNSTTASGFAAHSEGNGSQATGDDSHSEGLNTLANAPAGHAEGENTTTSGAGAHAEGQGGTASGAAAHAEGNGGTASGNSSHVEGTSSQATQTNAHAEGDQCLAAGFHAHSEGSLSTANGNQSHCEGRQCTTNFNASHAEGFATTTNQVAAHSEGNSTLASGAAAHVEGDGSTGTDVAAHAEGDATLAEARGAHAEGVSSQSSAIGSHAEGIGGQALRDGEHCHASGPRTLNALAATRRRIVLRGSTPGLAVGETANLRYGVTNPASEQFTLEDNKSYTFDFTLTVRLVTGESTSIKVSQTVKTAGGMPILVAQSPIITFGEAPLLGILFSQFLGPGLVYEPTYQIDPALTQQTDGTCTVEWNECVNAQNA